MKEAMEQTSIFVTNLTLLLCCATAAASAAAGGSEPAAAPLWPLVINVWPFLDATERAWAVVSGGGSPVDAVVEGCSVCEREQCDLSVGFGGSPGENGETTLDALVMDGDSMDVGAVGGLRRVKHAVRAARMVLQHTRHSLLVGDQATAFALEMGLPGPEDLSTPVSRAIWEQWQAQECQPNYRVNVTAVPACGPYHPISPHSLPFPRQQSWQRVLQQKGEPEKQQHRREWGRERDFSMKIKAGADALTRAASVGGSAGSTAGDASSSRELRGGGWGRRPELRSHDTITMVAIGKNGSMAAGSSTNGLTFHVPGRVGDAPVAGAGVYVDSEVGGCGATGDGDVMMRFLPCFHAVELMRSGVSPTLAAQQAILRIKRKYPLFQGALFAVNRTGSHGAAVNNWVLHYTVRDQTMSKPHVYKVEPILASL